MPPCSHRPSVSLPRSAATPPFRATQAAGARSVRRAQTPTASAGGRRGHTPSRRRRSCAPSWASACATNRARTMAATTTTTQFGATSRARPARRRQAIPPTSSVRLAPLPPNPRPGLSANTLIPSPVTDGPSRPSFSSTCRLRLPRALPTPPPSPTENLPPTSPPPAAQIPAPKSPPQPPAPPYHPAPLPPSAPQPPSLPRVPCYRACTVGVDANCTHDVPDQDTYCQAEHSIAYGRIVARPRCERRVCRGHYALRCDATQCDATRCDAMRRDTTRHEAMRCDAMRCDAMRCDAMLCDCQGVCTGTTPFCPASHCVAFLCSACYRACLASDGAACT
jgi:hypothetical protein